MSYIALMKENDPEEQLAEAYNSALALEKAGDHAGAAKLYARVLELHPEDCGGAVIRLAAMGLGEVPARAPEAYIAMLFDQHAEVFDDILVDKLGYHVPLLLRQALDEQRPGPYQRLLDLGCGTGLAGVALADITSHRTGIDLSSRIVDVAAEHELYDDLYVGDAVEFVTEVEDEPWDLVVATDVLPYLGDVNELIRGVSRISTPKAVFAFSTETMPEDAMGNADFMVGPHQRFLHKQGYISATLAAAGFAIVTVNDIIVRHESGVPQPGQLFIAERI